jgi:hypothetical protein
VTAPATDEMATIEPLPWRAMTRAACLSVSSVPVRLRSSVRRHAPASTWVSGPMVSEPPALMTTPSSRPVPAVAAATAAATASSSVTSAGTVVTAVPGAAASMVAAAAASRSSERPAMVTAAPSTASRTAQASPMPLPPPVTRAEYPARSCPFVRATDRPLLTKASPRLRSAASGRESRGSEGRPTWPSW